MNSKQSTQWICGVCGKVYSEKERADSCCSDMVGLDKILCPYQWYILRRYILQNIPSGFNKDILTFIVGIIKEDNRYKIISSLGEIFYVYRPLDIVETLGITEAYEKYGVIPEFERRFELVMDYVSNSSPFGINDEIRVCRERQIEKMKKVLLDIPREEVIDILLSIMSGKSIPDMPLSKIIRPELDFYGVIQENYLVK